MSFGLLRTKEDIEVLLIPAELHPFAIPPDADCELLVSRYRRAVFNAQSYF